MEKCAQLSDVARLSVEPGRRAGAVRAGGAAGGPGPRHRGAGRRYHPGAQVQLNTGWKFFLTHNKSFRWHLGDYEKHIFFPFESL